MPRHVKRPGSALHRLDDLLGDFLVDVWCLLVHGAFSLVVEQVQLLLHLTRPAPMSVFRREFAGVRRSRTGPREGDRPVCTSAARKTGETLGPAAGNP